MKRFNAKLTHIHTNTNTYTANSKCITSECSVCLLEPLTLMAAMLKKETEENHNNKKIHRTKWPCSLLKLLECCVLLYARFEVDNWNAIEWIEGKWEHKSENSKTHFVKRERVRERDKRVYSGMHRKRTKICSNIAKNNRATENKRTQSHTMSGEIGGMKSITQKPSATTTTRKKTKKK